MRTALVFTVVSLAFFGCARAQAPVEVADGRDYESPADLTEWLARPPMAQAIDAARAYWRKQDAGYEEDVRVVAVAEGAFTRPGAEQQAVLFLMSLWPRCCPKMGLAVLEGGELVRHIAFEGPAQELRPIADLDGDGRDELVYIGSFGMGGQESRGFTLMAFGADGLAEWGGTSIYDSSCGAGMSGTTAARVTALPGPEFLVERYTQATCETETWQSLGEPEPLDLDASTGIAYIDLPVE